MPNWDEIYYDHEAIEFMDPEDLWIYDKLIVSKKLGYVCGPVGVDVPYPGHYILRPTINFLGMGLGTKRVKLIKSTDRQSPGYFWSQEFQGRHLSIDYKYGKQQLAVEGEKYENSFTKWKKWSIIDAELRFPEILEGLKDKYPWFCCEFIDGKLIEVHARRNPDFIYGNKEFIPAWRDEEEVVLLGGGYRFVECQEVGGRIGAFIK